MFQIAAICRREPRPLDASRPFASWIRFATASIALCANSAIALQFQEINSLAAPIVPAQLVLAPAHGKLLFRSSALIAVLNTQTAAVTLRLPTKTFTDMALAPSGHFVFAADYGGDNYGYEPHVDNSLVHRLDLAGGLWEVNSAAIAGHVQVINDSQFLLKSLDQWVTFTNNLWSVGGAAIPINTSSGEYFEPGYYPSVYDGEFRYDAGTGRLVHGNMGSSSHELQAFKLLNNDFFKLESSGIYGSADAYGGTLAMATDGSAFYFGKLKVDPLDVTHNVKVFPELIYAATGDVALGNGKYYDARTGVLLGTLGFSTTIYSLNPNGQEFWAYDAVQNRVRHFVAIATPPPVGTCSLLNHPFSVNVTGAAGGNATSPARAGQTEFNPAPGNSLIGMDIEDKTIRLFNNSASTSATFPGVTTYTAALGAGSPLSITGVSVTINGVSGFSPASVSFTGKSVTFTLTGSTWHAGDSAEVAVQTNCEPCSLDIDGDGNLDALTDGLLMLRAMFGLTGTAVTNSAVAPGASRANWAAIRPLLNNICGGNFAP